MEFPIWLIPVLAIIIPLIIIKNKESKKGSSDKGEERITLVVIIGIGVLLSGVVLGFYYSSLPGHNPAENQQGCENAEGLPKGTCSL